MNSTNFSHADGNALTSKRPVVAIYARFSCDKQSEASIEDQVRRCRELAVQRGLIADDALVFSDAAVSGTDKGDAHRDGYYKLLAAWESGQFQVLLVDELSRLTRDGVELARLLKRLENSARVRLVTADGIDTNDADWQLRLGLQGLLAQQETRKTRHRVARGMLGQLERGYMLAAPAYGYDLQRKYDDTGKHLGSIWKTNEDEARIVRKVFALREAGTSMHEIAAWLNAERIACSRKPRTEAGGHWRPARVRQMLVNPIYRGEFVWHGSLAYAHGRKKQGREIETRSYARPDLRLISDETWYRCNQRQTQRSSYGSVTHPLSGLLTCGHCGASLVLSSKAQKSRALYCAVCTEAKRSKADDKRQTVTVAVAGVQELLRVTLRHFISEPFMQAFRNSLELRLSGNNAQEIAEEEKHLSQLRAAQLRLSHLLSGPSGDDPLLTERYQETRERVSRVEQRVRELKQQKLVVDEKVLQVQLQANPARLLEQLFEAEVEPARLRVVLGRLFPSIVLLGKSARCTSHFLVRFAPGIAMAEVSATRVVSEHVCEAQFSLHYTPRNMPKPAGWAVLLRHAPAPVSSADEGTTEGSATPQSEGGRMLTRG